MKNKINLVFLLLKYKQTFEYIFKDCFKYFIDDFEIIIMYWVHLNFIKNLLYI